jgi:hypothetical protein
MPSKSGKSKGRGEAIRDQKLALWRDKNTSESVDIRRAARKIPVNKGALARRTTPAGKGRSG